MTFSADPWAKTFLDVLSARRAFPSEWTEREAVLAGEALEALDAFCAAGLSVPGKLSGFGGAARIIPFIDAALAKTDGNNEAVLYARTFFLLMVRKGRLHYYKKIIDRAQKIVNEKIGLVEAVLETPFEVDGDFAESVKQSLLQKTRAHEITIQNCLVPELGGGMRLRMGGVLFDGSLKARLEQMKADLSGG